ncbi:MAG: hypothetical protein MRZ25_05800 [Ruminococcus sp.]|nr:hypothetical protein [Ruminococcus sp.]
MEKMTFNDKLKIMCDIFLKKHKKTLLKYELVSIENKLKNTIPEPLREFYLMFGEDLDLLKCMYNIASPKELNVENNVLMIAKEYQNVCCYGVSLDTQKPMYFDDSNNIIRTVNLDIEDFLIYLLAVQSTQYLNCIGTIEVGLIEELKKCLIRITKDDGEGAVFCSRDGIIAVVVKNNIFISAQNDKVMKSFENESGLDIDFL